MTLITDTGDTLKDEDEMRDLMPTSSRPELLELVEQWRATAALMKANGHTFPDRFTFEHCANELEALLSTVPRPQEEETSG